jgi:hypothetical protein
VRRSVPARLARALVDRPSVRQTALLTGGLAVLAIAAVPTGHAVSDVLDEVSRAADEASTGPDQQRTDVRTASVAGAATEAAVPATSEPLSGERSAPAPAEDTTTASEDAGEAAQVRRSETTVDPAVWDELADCESGDWLDGVPQAGTARWDYGLEFAHEGYELFEGGLNFHPDTWDEFRDPDMPGHAGEADREQEIVVAERVLAAQGWEAWPVCSEMLGLR